MMSCRSNGGARRGIFMVGAPSFFFFFLISFFTFNQRTMSDNNPHSGWITLHRKMLNWEWYDDTNTKVLFLHCLLRASYEDNTWHGVKIKRGQFLTSYQKL